METSPLPPLGDEPDARTRIGEILVDAGVITPQDLVEILEFQSKVEGRPPRLGNLIVEQGLATEEAIARGVAQQLNLPYIELGQTVADPPAMNLVPRPLARRHQMIPVRRTSDGLLVAMADPTNVVAIDDVRAVSGISKIELAVATVSAIEDAESRFYASDLGAGGILDRMGVASEVDIDATEPQAADVSDPEEILALQRSAATGPIVRLVNAILADAIRGRATDIHIEPQTNDVKVRYRIDGLLREVMALPKQVQALVISRLKILSGMDIAERRRPQDGRGRFVAQGQDIDTRVSTIPTFSGEKAVIRLLPKGQKLVEMADLGLYDNQLEIVQQYLTMPQGLVIFTGPTGAGKTSTMYSALTFIHSAEKNMVTLEDPIEYQIPGLNQVQIDEKSGITFARGLRSILRQDPDVIMVGEIRDLEAAQIVMQSALTGHLVFTSLHTNDAASAITRLVDLGVEPFLISSALTLVVAQRLVRVICRDCAAPAEVSERTLTSLGFLRTDVPDMLPRGEGCERCSYTGYRGRIGIFEVLPVSNELRRQMTTQLNETSIHHTVRMMGVKSLRENGLQRVREGVTTLDEVLRVTYMERAEIPRCPSCRHDVEASWLLCPYCQADLGGLTCPSCNRQTDSEWRVCPYCRSELPAAYDGPRNLPRVLVVDDDPSLRKLSEAMFGDEYEVSVAADGNEGIKKATLERPDLILLDLRLPDMSGTEVAERLRSRAATSLIPLIMLTAEAGDAAELESLRSGVDDYITKPFDEQLLKARMQNVLRRAHRAGTFSGAAD
jgi:type IV pilus assembly protein PilB